MPRTQKPPPKRQRYPQGVGPKPRNGQIVNPFPPCLTQRKAAEKAAMKEIEKAGPCVKMSNQKMPVTGMTRWQERHLHLQGLRLSWSLGSGKAERKALELTLAMTIEKAEALSPKVCVVSWVVGGSEGVSSLAPAMTAHRVVASAPAWLVQYIDCYRPEDRHSMMSMLTQPMGAMMSETMGTVDKNNCIAIRKPQDLSGTFNSAMGAMNQSPLGLAFGGGAKKMQKEMDASACGYPRCALWPLAAAHWDRAPAHFPFLSLRCSPDTGTTARTYYFTFESQSERDEWFDAIMNNIEKNRDDPAFNGGGRMGAFQQGLITVGANLEGVDLEPYLDTLYQD